MSALHRTLQFAVFTLIEYLRSGRIMVEALATAAAFYLLFRRWTTPMAPEYFFSTVGLFTLGLTFYTGSAILALGDRPPGYVLLARRLGRGPYLLGLYTAILAVTWGVYGVICLLVAATNPVDGLDLRGWLLGTAPLLLNLALLAALLTLLSPIVLPAPWRLAVLALVALAFSGSLIGGPTMASLPAPVAVGLDVLRTVLSTPLLPAFTGFAISVSRDYSGVSIAIPVAQLFLVIGMLALAVYTFARRELIFSS
ncbi:MAG: hypothetical protein HXY39_08840 [Chloroflexi bacterium]|nr:hypothetical protein [Chloroflexota bacterium]